MAHEHGIKYHHFTLTNYGECWTTKNIVYTLHKLESSKTCFGSDYQDCNMEDDTECMGREDSQMVYHVLYEKEDKEETLKLTNSHCFIETLTVCSSPSVYTRSTTRL